MKRRHGTLGFAIGALCLGLLPAPGALAAGFTYKAVAFLDTKAPGGGMLVNDFEPGAVSPLGEVAFVVDYEPPDTTGEGLYLGSGGALTPIVEPGKPAVDDWSFASEGEIDAIISPVGMNGNGDVSFGVDILKKGETDVKTGTFLWQHDTAKVIAIELPDQDAPGGGKFGTIQGHTWTDVNDQRDVAFSVQVPDASGAVEQGVFVRLADGTYKSIARPGDKLPDGTVIAWARRPNINNAGAVLFEAQVDKDSARGIYLAENGSIKTIAAPGMDAPGGGKIQDVRNGRLNNKGDIVFLGDNGAGWGVYRLPAGKPLEAIAAAGATLRDGAVVKQSLDKDGTLSLADSGDVAMHLDLAGEAEHGIYLLHGDQLELVAKDGMDLTGVGPVEDTKGEVHVAVNGLGEVAFQAELKDGRTALVLASPVP